jgi:hypothetical protein
MRNDGNIVKIIEYLSTQFLGTPEDPEDVKIKYLIEDEKHPYWCITHHLCYSFKEYEKLNKFIDDCGYKMTICGKGFWLMEKKFKDNDND